MPKWLTISLQSTNYTNGERMKFTQHFDPCNFNLVYRIEIPQEEIETHGRMVPDLHEVGFAPGLGISLDVKRDQGWPPTRPDFLDAESLPAQLMRLAYLTASIIEAGSSQTPYIRESTKR